MAPPLEPNKKGIEVDNSSSLCGYELIPFLIISNSWELLEKADIQSADIKAIIALINNTITKSPGKINPELNLAFTNPENFPSLKNLKPEDAKNDMINALEEMLLSKIVLCHAIEINPENKSPDEKKQIELKAAKEILVTQYPEWNKQDLIKIITNKDIAAIWASIFKREIVNSRMDIFHIKDLSEKRRDVESASLSSDSLSARKADLLIIDPRLSENDLINAIIHSKAEDLRYIKFKGSKDELLNKLGINSVEYNTYINNSVDSMHNFMFIAPLTLPQEKMIAYAKEAIQPFNNAEKLLDRAKLVAVIKGRTVEQVNKICKDSKKVPHEKMQDLCKPISWAQSIPSITRAIGF